MNSCQQWMRVPIAPYPLQCLTLSVLFILVFLSSRWVIVSHWGFNFFSQITSSVECIFMCLLAIYISSLSSISPDLLLNFKLNFVYLLLNFQSSLCILDVSPLSNTCLANISSWSVAFLFTFLTISQIITFWNVITTIIVISFTCFTFFWKKIQQMRILESFLWWTI